jgi:UDP-N-acetylglucosamine 4-epimerase
MILITGALGFIGSHLVANFLLKDKTVIGIDDWSRGKNFINHNNFHLIGDRVQNISESLKGLADKIDCVVHLAAYGSVPKSFENPKKYWTNNTNSMHAVLEFCKTNNIPLVWASSSSVYGDSTELPRQEDVIGKPLSPYALTKQTCEQMADFYCNTFKMKITGLRFFNVYGPWQNPDYGAVIPKWICGALNNKPLIVNGSRGILRDFTYVTDIVDGIVCAIQQQVNGNFNLGRGIGVTLGELIDEINLIKPVAFDVGNYRPGDSLASIADISKAKAFLGYNPKVGIKEGIKKTWDHYEKRPKVYTN